MLTNFTVKSSKIPGLSKGQDWLLSHRWEECDLLNLKTLIHSTLGHLKPPRIIGLYLFSCVMVKMNKETPHQFREQRRLFKMKLAALHWCVGTFPKLGQSPTLKSGKSVTCYIAKTPFSQLKSTCKDTKIFFIKQLMLQEVSHLQYPNQGQVPFIYSPLGHTTAPSLVSHCQRWQEGGHSLQHQAKIRNTFCN